MKTGQAYLVGTGPGDLGLVTLRARQLIEEAEVIIYDYLCNPEVLRWAQPSAEILYAGKQGGHHTLTQDQINARLIEYVRAGKVVVRLKGGDPFVFGRGGEEAQEMVQAGLPFEIVPGVTSAVAAPAYAGIPVTHRDFTSSVTFLTGHEDPEKPNSALDWQRLAGDPGTKVILMGVERLRRITEELQRHGATPETLCALIRWGTYPRQQTLEGTLGSIAELAEQRHFKAPAIFIIGGVVSLRRELNWFEKRPLFGQRIVVTRTRQQASTLASKLAGWGADVLEMPTIRIQPREWTAKYDLGQIAQQAQWLVFTSPNAVEHFFHGFFSTLPDLRQLGPVKIAAVGPATAAKIRQWHLSVDRQPDKFTVEALTTCWQKEEINGQHFVLIRGNLADPILAEHLSAQGGKVAEWTIYDTLPESDDLCGTRQRLVVEGADWVTFTSSSTVENWHRLDLRTWADQKKTRFASMGPVTSQTMKKLGYPVDVEAEQSNIDSLVAAILNQTKKN